MTLVYHYLGMEIIGYRPDFGQGWLAEGKVPIYLDCGSNSKKSLKQYFTSGQEEDSLDR